MSKAVFFVAIGLVGLVFGGEFIVDGASGIARSLGMAERVIGLVIVGPGTSFPELIISQFLNTRIRLHVEDSWPTPHCGFYSAKYLKWRCFSRLIVHNVVRIASDNGKNKKILEVHDFVMVIRNI